jgi:hypothetical protein
MGLREALAGYLRDQAGPGTQDAGRSEDREAPWLPIPEEVPERAGLERGSVIGRLARRGSEFVEALPVTRRPRWPTATWC